LAPFFDFDLENRSYSKAFSETKSYTLRPQVAAALDQVMQSRSPLVIVATDAKGNTSPVTVEELPANGIPQELGSSLFLPSVIPIASGTLHKAREWIQNAVADYGEAAPLDAEKGTGTTLADAYRQLSKIERWHDALGGIPNFYTEQAHGRLGPANDCHVIALPRILRQLVLQDSGLVDHDIKSCNWSLYLSRAQSLNLETVKAENYAAAKNDWHSRLQWLTGRGSKDAWKSVLLSWLTGASLASSRSTAAGKLVGCESRRRVANDPILRGLHREVTAGMKQIITNSRKAETEVTANAVGKVFRMQGEASDFGRACAHELTGLESFAIRSMCEGVQGLAAIVYDGWLSEPVSNVAGLVAKVRQHSIEQLGFPLEIELKVSQITAPAPYSPIHF